MIKSSYSDFLRKCKNEEWAGYTADLYKKYSTVYSKIKKF